MPKFFFRPAEKSDCAALVKLAYGLNSFHGLELEPSIKKLEADWDRVEAYVAENENLEIVAFLQGYNTYQLHDTTVGFEIQNLYIAEQFRRQGLGRLLSFYTIEKKHREGTEVFRLTVLKDNISAKVFYESNGFVLRDGNFLYFGKLSGDALKKYLNQSS